ncbi:hypothetical protein LV779_24810 [Streptomyces thinghirensis]|nr:hypothetical protein [Streptomyces thinghirensis]
MGSIAGIQGLASNLAGFVSPLVVGALLDTFDGSYLVPPRGGGAGCPWWAPWCTGSSCARSSRWAPTDRAGARGGKERRGREPVKPEATA